MILDGCENQSYFQVAELMTIIQSVTSRAQNGQLDVPTTREIAQAVLEFVRRENLMSEHHAYLAPPVLTDDDVRVLLQKQMAAAGGLIKWAKAHELPISRVSEFHTGRRPASLAILVALGLTRAIVPLDSARAATHP